MVNVKEAIVQVCNILKVLNSSPHFPPIRRHLSGSTNEATNGSAPLEQKLPLGEVWLCFLGTKEHDLVNHFARLKSNLLLNFPCLAYQSATTDHSCEVIMIPVWLHHSIAGEKGIQGGRCLAGAPISTLETNPFLNQGLWHISPLFKLKHHPSTHLLPFQALDFFIACIPI